VAVRDTLAGYDRASLGMHLEAVVREGGAMKAETVFIGYLSIVGI